MMLVRTQPRKKIDVRIKPELAKQLEQFARSRGVTFSRAVEYVLEAGFPDVLAREGK